MTPLDSPQSSKSKRMLEELSSLHELGWGIHWLRYESKAPKNKGWATLPRLDWGALLTSYCKGDNVGVVLGEISKVGTGYLACFDCDLKTNDPADREAMQKCIKEILPSGSTPLVMSGRNNGSCHYYVRIKEPCSPIVCGRSAEKVEMGDGRKSFKWEVVLYSAGRQMVLPPSVHELGGMYQWDIVDGYPTCAEDIPFISTDALRKDEIKDAAEVELFDAEKKIVGRIWKWNDDVDLSRLDKRDVELISLGKGSYSNGDRSSDAFIVAGNMIRSGFNEDDIMSIFTNKKYFLGRVAYDHGRKGRMDAARWFEKYSFRHAKLQNSPQLQFANEGVDVVLDADATEKQLSEIVDWKSRFERYKKQGDYKPKPTVKNTILVLENAFEKAPFTRDEFSGNIYHAIDAPWNNSAKRFLKGSALTNDDLACLRAWLPTTFEFEPTKDVLYDAIVASASANSFHPVREYLHQCWADWDGVARVDGWLKNYLSVDDVGKEKYIQEVSRIILIAMVARIFNPGVKFDNLLVIEGNQGIGKSRSLAALGGKWFSDFHLDVEKTDSILALNNVWLSEVGELSSLRKADVDRFKEFLSRQVDRIRVPYGRTTEDFPRQSIFIGTTNGHEYLKDKTGNRRIWPVRVAGKCDVKKIARDRNQLFGEAMHLYLEDHDLYLSEEVSQIAREEQEDRVVCDPWDERVADIVGKMSEETLRLGLTIQGVATALGLMAGPSQYEASRIGGALRGLGFIMMQRRPSRKRIYYKPEHKPGSSPVTR